MVGATDAAAVFSLLGTNATALNERVASALEIESGTNDPFAIFLTLATLASLQAPETFGFLDALKMLGWQMLAGAGGGLGREEEGRVGKGWAVRVDIGGGRTLKKKKRNEHK